MDNFFLADHPLITHKVAILRDEQTDSKLFRELCRELSSLLAYEATRDLKLEREEITTPVAQADAARVSESVTGVVILRAGLGMLDGFLGMMPYARVGFIGLYRDPLTLRPIDYYVNLPAGLDESFTVLMDPMLATAGSSIAAVDFLKKNGAKKIKMICLIASEPGVEAFSKAHPDVPVYAAALDGTLNRNGYIVPGLGDAGDRVFNTESEEEI